MGLLRVSVAICLAIGVVARPSLLNCGGISDHFVVKNLTVSPDPPQRGDEITLTLEGVFDKDMASGRVDVDIEVNALSLFNIPLHQSLSFSTAPLLMRKGNQKLVIGPFELPRYVPGSLQASGRIRVVDELEEQVLCVDVDINVPAMTYEHAREAVMSLACGVQSSHITDISSNQVIDDDIMHGFVAGILDELVTKARVDVDVQLHAGFVPMSFKLPVPVAYMPGFPAGAFNLTASMPVDSKGLHNSERSRVSGVLVVSDSADQELFCLEVDAANHVEASVV
uniref:MD-2-related lipid-recognition domain-containing protein n=1 Tax=Noctiluca scintillans TaxID=2966 RepID=A0A7S0ZX63_NOCSC|mmetsp:Transcript_22242/g.58919  ORF Transcript_22242/g.58919 Transcript_22242/m.58919 type:complete len:282 (+) Transcript_22242:64-909(+)